MLLAFGARIGFKTLRLTAPIPKGDSMRILACSILAATMALAALPAQAQTYDPNYPVCMHIFGSLEGDYFDCSFTSLPQCQATASGRPAQCLVNPYYAPVREVPSGRAHHRRHRYVH
jgi:hypothetical protein